MITFSYWKPETAFTFWHVNGREKETVTFLPYLSMNDFAGLTPALLAGEGIGELPPIVQPELIRDGRLVEVMPDWRFRTYDLSLVHLASARVAAGKVAPSPMPRQKRIANSVMRPPTAPVAIVVSAQASAHTAKVRRAP